MNINRLITSSTAGLAALTLAACTTLGASGAQTPVSTITGTTQTAQTSSTVSTSTTTGSQTTTADSGTTAATTTGFGSLDTHWDEDDLVWDPAEEQSVALADGATSADSEEVTVAGDVVTITAGGVYRLTGSLSDGQVVVTAPEDETVTLILDGADVTSTTGPALAVVSADEVTVVLADGTDNALTDGSDYEVTDDSTPVAALASASDLTLAGSGSLIVTGRTNDGISSSDGLVLTTGTGQVTVEAVDDGVRGKDYVYLLGGALTVTAGGDGVKADNTTDADRGWVLVDGAEVTVDAGDDGVKGEQGLQVSSGAVTVTSSVEGMESAAILITGGTVDVTASDDGLNATAVEGVEGGTESDDGSLLQVSGGTVTVVAGTDGLDVNGSAELLGGAITITSAANGMESPVDVNGELTLDGATVSANGTAITSADQLAVHPGGPGGGMGPGPRG